MKKDFKKDLFYLLLLTIMFISIFLIIKGNNLYSSKIDNISQHTSIPEYFRSLFYKTGDLFPDFAYNLGSGQNIYNYSYYGLLNPIIIFSYFLPFVEMRLYVIYSTLLLIYISVIMMYFFVKKKFNSDIAFVSSICFMCSGSLLFHTHRHIMFVNYMPMLILGLFGVDRYFEKNDKKLLCISTLLIILMSFYYSIPSIIVLIIYGVYNYLKLNEKITFKNFIKDGFKFIFPIFCGVLISSILIIPTFYVLLNGRFDTNVSISLKELIIPNFNIEYFMYNAYGICLNAFSLLALINCYDKKRENKFLVIVLCLIMMFPLFNYILNATMYIDSKCLIPFLPLLILLIGKLFNDAYNKKINFKKQIILVIIVSVFVFFTKKDYSILFLIDICFSLVMLFLLNKNIFKKVVVFIILLYLSFLTIKINQTDKLYSKKDYYSDSNINQKELTSKISTIDRTTMLNYNLENVNSINSDMDIYQSYIYSSVNNYDYNVFFFDTFENVMQSRNRMILTANKNLLFLMFTNNKYVISDNFNVIGYDEIDSINNTKLYKNDDVLPMMYVSNNIMNESEFNNYSFPYTNEILLNYVVDNKDTTSGYKTKINSVDLNDIKLTYSDDAVINGNIVNVSKKGNLVYELPEYVYGKILFITFDIDEAQSCLDGDLAIDINGNLNKLTCREWKYYNDNTKFSFVIADKDLNSLNVKLIKGKYSISNLNISYLDYSDIKDINNNVSKVNIDSIKGNKIKASVSTLNDGVFVSSIPFDKGFTVLVDGKKTKYRKVNTAFLGFDLEKGKHNIEIVYHSPFKKLGIIMSCMGILIYVFFVRKAIIKK